MVTPVSMNCFWMDFHDCTSTITSRSLSGWTGRSQRWSSGPAALSVLVRTTSSRLGRWLASDWCPRDLRIVFDREFAGAQRRNGLDASNHAKQHMSNRNTFVQWHRGWQLSIAETIALVINRCSTCFFNNIQQQPSLMPGGVAYLTAVARRLSSWRTSIGGLFRPFIQSNPQVD